MDLASLTWTQNYHVSNFIDRFDAQCLKDIIEKYEENLGFEKSFVSILANKTKREIEEIRRFYRKDFHSEMYTDILKWVIF